MTAPDEALDFDERLAAFESTRFTELRPGQRQVLAAYAADHRDTPDLAIEMPTGEGKTLVALMIADYALDRGYSAAYLTGTRQLAERVATEAEALGLDVVRFAGKDYGGAKLDDYHQAQVVGVMNYWVYFNASPVPKPADLVILDDAHLAEQPVSSIQTLRIPDKAGDARNLYRMICGLVIAHTDSYPGLRAMQDGTALPGTPPELLSFKDWKTLEDRTRAAIESSPFIEKKEVKYVWPIIRDRLSRCGVLIGPSGIEIRPYHPPTTLNKWYSQAKQRIYLSATLGTMDDLQRRVGGRPITRLSTVEPLQSGATGDRIFLLNPSSEDALAPQVFAWALEQSKKAGGRAAWLCSSHPEAETLEEKLVEEGMSVYRLKPGDDTQFDSWTRAADGHLVTAGRYDGLDFAGDLCKLVIIPTVPQASSEFERFVVAYLGDASFMRHRVGQRVTQALGRANREPTDRSMYLGLDPLFAQILADPTVRQSIPDGASPIVREALQIYETGWAGTQEACNEFWSQTVTTGPMIPPSGPSRRRRPGRNAGGSSTVSSADHEVTAVADLWLSDYKEAAKKAREASAMLAEAGEAEHAAFWRYVEAHAHFVGEDYVATRAALEDATRDGPRTTWFLRLRRTIADLEGQSGPADDSDRLFLVWDEWRREAGPRLQKTLSQGRVSLAGTHNQQCEGLRVLARLAGATGELPPKNEQSATDCRWTWSTTKKSERRVWEVKTVPNGTPSPLSRGDVNQLLGQIQVDTTRSPNARVLGCLLTPSTEVTPDAQEAARDKIALINHDAVLRLYDLLADRIIQYDSLCEDDSADARGTARTAVEARLPDARWLGSFLSPSHGKLLTMNDVSSLFPA
ncbi:Type III restriction enzyme, res subunit [Rhodococcus pyridinivorans]|nr:Type III restriction enzyme, res subunit [Rhodococcus pyridinivorans]